MFNPIALAHSAGSTRDAQSAPPLAPLTFTQPPRDHKQEKTRFPVRKAFPTLHSHHPSYHYTPHSTVYTITTHYTTPAPHTHHKCIILLIAVHYILHDILSLYNNLHAIYIRNVPNKYHRIEVHIRTKYIANPSEFV